MNSNNLLILNGVKYDGVVTHPRRKSRNLRKLPNTIWIKSNSDTSILKVAESYGYRYVFKCSVIKTQESKRVRYDKFHLINSDNISGLRKPWE